jgi:ketosteroid isomerase-like protein
MPLHRDDGNLVYRTAKWTVSGLAKAGGRKSYSGTMAKDLEKQSDRTWNARMHVWNMDPVS